jgi:hypothetical protein
MGARGLVLKRSTASAPFLFGGIFIHAAERVGTFVDFPWYMSIPFQEIGLIEPTSASSVSDWVGHNDWKASK